MTEIHTSKNTKKNVSADWLVRGILTKFGDIFDRLTGRKWQTSSSLATSELIEKLKKLLASEIRDSGANGKFVPHDIKLKMQWDKFSTDGEKSLKSLETELLTATIDYINDNHYHTYAPVRLTVKTDYFTEGVKLTAGYDDSSEDGREINVNEIDHKQPADPAATSAVTETYIAVFGDQRKSVRLVFNGNQRLSVGRTRENSLVIEDPSVSKTHASLFVNAENLLTVADTGSTNGTFIDDQRIAYGKAYPLSGAAKVKFGTIEIAFEHLLKTASEKNDEPSDDSFRVGEFEFKTGRRIKINEIADVLEIKPSEKSADEFEMTQRISKDI